MTLMPASDHLQSVLYDPLSYIHPYRLRMPVLWSSEKHRSIVNQMLIEAYGLPTSPEQHRGGEIDDVMVRHWRQLPQAAFALSCLEQRTALMSRGLFLKLPRWARDFALLPAAGLLLRHDTEQRDMIDVAVTKYGDETNWLLAYGLAKLLWYCRKLPLSITARIPLLFPQFSSVAHLNCTAYSRHAPGAHERTLFILAIQHVEKYPLTVADSRGRIAQTRTSGKNSPPRTLTQ